MTTTDKTIVTANGPSKKNKKAKNKYGNPKMPKPMDLPTLVTQHATKKVTVTRGANVSKVNFGEAYIEKMFFDTISGDAKAAKRLVRLAIKYVPKFEMPKLNGYFSTHWFDKSDVTLWKEMGCLPPDAPDDIMKVSTAKLNKAFKAMKNLTEKDWDAYFDNHPEKLSPSDYSKPEDDESNDGEAE